MLDKKSIINSLPRSLLATAFLASLVLAQGKGFTIQVAATTTETEALTLINDFNSVGVEAYLVKSDVPGIGTRYRVRIGRFNTQTVAKSVAEKSRGKGLIKEFFITTYETPTTVTAKAASPQTSGAPGSSGAPGRALTSEAAVISEGGQSRISGQAAAYETKRDATLPLIEVADPVINRKSGSEKETRDDVSIFDVEIGNNNWKVARGGSGSEKNLRSLWFVDALTGWAAGEGGTVYRTTDGGREWKPIAIEIGRAHV